MKTCSLKGRPVKKRVVPLLLSLCLVMSLLPMTVFAAETDDYQAMELDTQYSAEIESEGEYAYFTFTAEETGYYQFYATDENTYCYVYDSDWNMYLAVTRCAVGYFEAGETYIVGFCYKSSDVTGSFNVYASSYELEEMQLDTEYTAEIDYACKIDYFSFTAEETGYYYFYSTGNEDTFGYLWDSAFNFVAFDDDSGEDANACIEVDLEAGETYIVGFCYLDDSTGSFSVYVSMNEPEIEESEIEIEAEMELDTETIAEIENEGDIAYFSFTAEEAGYYQFYSTGDEDTYGYLYDIDWNFITSDDDSGEDWNFCMTSYMEAGETCIVGVSYLDSGMTGNISVYVTSFELAIQGELQLDTESIAEIESAEEVAYFTFTAEEAGYYKFYSTGDEDTFGHLYDVNLNIITSDDDSGEDLNCSIVFYLEEGETCIVGFSYVDDSTGSFSVYVTAIPEDQCGDDAFWYIEDGTLYIYGTGEMYDYEQLVAGPWRSYVDEITSIVIEDGITYIGTYAFWYMYNVTSVSIGSTVETIAAGAFDTISASEIVIPASVTYIGEEAFVNCYSLESVTFEEGSALQYVGESAFGGCDALTSVTFEGAEMQLDTESIAEIESEGDYAFFTFTPEESGYYQFYSTGDEDTVVYVYNTTFDLLNSGDVVTIYLEADTTYIAGFCYASEDVTGSFSVYVTAISEDQCGDDAFWYIEDGTLYITGTGEMYDYEQLVAGPWRSYVDEITSIVIEDGITYIGTYAFWEMYNVTSVSIGSTVETIAEGAFDTLFASEIVIPASVTSIESYAFQFSVCLESVTFEEGSALEEIGTGAFFMCSFTEIVLPDSVSYIGPDAFAYCWDLESITLSESLEEILSCAFYGCASLTEISIPDSVTYIGPYAFDYCTSLESVTLSESLETIESFAFYECTSLTDITIPASVEYIGYEAFGGCDALSTVTFEGDLPEGYYIFGDLSQTITICISSCYINSLDEDLLQTLVGDVSYTLETYENHTYPEWYPTEYNGHSYYVFSMEDLGLETWEEAEAYCESVGGYLAAITTAEEDAFLYSYVSGTSYNDKCVYFGLSDAEEEGVWVWANGEETEYTNWNEENGEPNGGTDENHAEYHEGYTDGTWNDAEVGEAVAFLCEWDSEEDIPEDLFTGPEITEATCTEDGYFTYNCAVCGEEVTEIVEEATGHSYVAVVTEPTCTEDGYTTYTCSVCGDTYTDLETSATGHSYDDGVITKEATETQEGEITYTCTVCGDTYTETIPATGSSDTGSDDTDDTTGNTDTDDTADDTGSDDTAGDTDTDDTAGDTGSDDTTGEADTDDTAGDTGSDDTAGDADTDDTTGDTGSDDTAGDAAGTDDTAGDTGSDDTADDTDTEDSTTPEEEEETDLVNGLANLGDGWALYADSEVVDYTGLVYNDKTYGGKYGWYFVVNGYVDFSYTGLVKYDGASNGIKEGVAGWYYVVNGCVDFSVTDVVYNDGTYGTAGWWYVKNAYVDFSYTGLVKHSADNGGTAGWYYVKNAYVDFSYTGLVKYTASATTGGGQSGWYYVKNANVDFSVTGLVYNPGRHGVTGYWYVKNANVKFSYNGVYVANGVSYSVTNGYAGE